MIRYKTLEEIEAMRASALLLGRTHGEVAKYIKAGTTTRELDKIAYQFICDHGAVPSFLNYGGFPGTLCLSVNESVVHGMPSDYALQEGDIISVDCGVLLNGYHADSAYTYPIGNAEQSVLDLLKATKESLYKGIEQVQLGNRIGDVAHAIQHFVESKGYSVVRELVGHGIGKQLHEKPEVPNYGRRGQGVVLRNGLVIAIEPMVNLGKKEVVFEKDGWTVRTKDRLPSAHYEHTVALVDGRAEILTTFSFIEEVFTF